jgi:hypothetical protein
MAKLRTIPPRRVSVKYVTLGPDEVARLEAPGLGANRVRWKYKGTVTCPPAWRLWVGRPKEFDDFAPPTGQLGYRDRPVL